MRIEYIFAVDPRTGEVSLLDDQDGEQVGLYNAKSDTVAFKPYHLRDDDFRQMAQEVWSEATKSDIPQDRVLH